MPSPARPLLYGANGKPITRRSMSPYDASGGGRRAKNWWPTTEAINALVQGNADVLRRRSRDMVRRNPLGSTARDRYVSNIIGTGIVPVSRAIDQAFRAQVRELWEEWTDESDADGISDFYGQQGLVGGQVFEAGECFARLRERRLSDGLSVPIQVQLLEADFLRSTMNENLTANGFKIRQGIEFNAIGQRVAYHFYREHPGERYSMNGITTTRVPASEVVQVFEPLRPGQLRGLPRMSPVLAKLYELDQYDDSQLARQRVAALFAFFFTKELPTFGAEDDPDDDTAKIESIEPGVGYELLPGERVETPTMPSVGSYIEFMRPQQRQVAGVADLTYEQLTGDVSQVNYSSARVNLLEIRRRHEQVQHGVICFQFNRPIWKRWFQSAVIAGRLTPPADYLERRRAYERVKWVPQGWQWVDPEKEIKAIVLAIRAGLLTRSMAVAQYGYDSEEIDREMAADNARADDLELSYESDARRDAPALIAAHEEGAAKARAEEAAAAAGNGNETPDAESEERDEAA